MHVKPHPTTGDEPKTPEFPNSKVFDTSRNHLPNRPEPLHSLSLRFDEFSEQDVYFLLNMLTHFGYRIEPTRSDRLAQELKDELWRHSHPRT